MKKFLALTIGLTLSLSTIFATTNADEFFNTYSSENLIENSFIIAGNENFQPTIVPKPGLLPGPSEENQNQTGQRNILVDTILPRLGITIIGFTGTASLIFLIVGAVRFVTAYGDEEAVEKAKRQVTYAIVGFVIALLAFVIVSIVTNIPFVGDESEQNQQNQEQPIPTDINEFERLEETTRTA